jgi:hypothetical protein
MARLLVLPALLPVLLLQCSEESSPTSVPTSHGADASAESGPGDAGKDEVVADAPGDAVDGGCTPAKAFTAQAWPAADALMHKEPRWLGGDAAYSVLLSPGRILWLFGDSFIATSQKLVRSESKMVRNSIAIQTGTDPTTSAIKFHWKESGSPSSFFPEEGAHWLWPVHGARVGSELVLFLSEITSSDAGLGFEGVGTRMLRIENPDAEPAAWTWNARLLPADGRAHGVGVVAEGDFLYSLTTRQTIFFDVELERWPLGSLDGDSTWWNGSAFSSSSEGPMPIWTGGAPEFITARHCGEYVTVESQGFGATDIVLRRAPALTGPWAEPVKVFHPEESDRPNPFVYAGKFHPDLTGGDIVATYAANSFDFAEVVQDMTLYFPRFVRISEKR